jgi:TnpA family transposase
MAGRSNIGLATLKALHDDYLYTENLAKGNAVLSDYIDQLPVSRAWDLYENKRVADGDGQKFVTKFHTLQSRFSAKYYRTRRGISIYTILANHIPLNAQAIGPHQHESHFVFDLTYNNLTNIPIDFITGDQHSINQLNYVAMDVIDTNFIPNIKQIRQEADKIYCVGEPKNYAGFLTPCGEIDLALIKSEKRGILRVLLSLLLQENTQAVIIRKLSSHKRYSRLQQALWEYNKIFKSIHILNVINDAELRKVIKTARNRTESYHQLQRGLRKVGSGTFKGRRIENNQMSCQATRLVANFMIAYNSTLLNGVYLRLVKQYDEPTAQSMMASISPVAWPHILLTGRYHFKEQVEKTDFDMVIMQLENNLRNRLM